MSKGRPLETNATDEMVRRSNLKAYFPAVFSRCPPNPKRIAESSLS